MDPPYGGSLVTILTITPNKTRQRRHVLSTLAVQVGLGVTGRLLSAGTGQPQLLHIKHKATVLKVVDNSISGRVMMAIQAATP